MCINEVKLELCCSLTAVSCSFLPHPWKLLLLAVTAPTICPKGLHRLLLIWHFGLRARVHLTFRALARKYELNCLDKAAFAQGLAETNNPLVLWDTFVSLWLTSARPTPLSLSGKTQWKQMWAVWDAVKFGESHRAAVTQLFPDELCLVTGAAGNDINSWRRSICSIIYLIGNASWCNMLTLSWGCWWCFPSWRNSYCNFFFEPILWHKIKGSPLLNIFKLSSCVLLKSEADLTNSCGKMTKIHTGKRRETW